MRERVIVEGKKGELEREKETKSKPKYRRHYWQRSTKQIGGKIARKNGAKADNFSLHAADFDLSFGAVNFS